jgi:hypothetical protein
MFGTDGCAPEKFRSAYCIRTYGACLFELIWYFEIMMILNSMKFVYELFGYLIRFVWLFFYPKAVLAARLLAIQSQLSMCKNRINLKNSKRSQLSRIFF